MSPSKQDQEAMFVVGERTGQIQQREFFDPELEGVAAVNIIEHKLHLMNCLGHLAAASMREGLVRAGEGVVLDRYGERASAVVVGAARQGEEHIKEAKWAFSRATGQFAMADSGFSTPRLAAAVTRGLFTQFKRKYYGARNHKAAHEYVNELGHQVDDLKTAVSSYNRERGLRPHKVEADNIPEDVSVKDRRELNKLTTRERMEAILFDPRAQFIPVTNLEKNVAITFLDYLDNPEYELGINNQLFEVLVHFQKNQYDKGTKALLRRGDSADGIRAVESKAWELGDFLSDAAKSYRLLSQFRSETADVSPAVSLAEELGSDHAAVVLLIRYSNLLEFMSGGRVSKLQRDPLRTAEERWIPLKAGPEPGKHKTIHSQYTRPKRTNDFNRYIDKRAKNMTFAEARKIVDDAMGNEYARARFFYGCLQDMDEMSDQRSLGQITDAVKQSLEAVDDEPVIELLRSEQHRQAA